MLFFEEKNDFIYIQQKLLFLTKQISMGGKIAIQLLKDL